MDEIETAYKYNGRGAVASAPALCMGGVFWVIWGLTYGFVATVSSLVILFVLGEMKFVLSFILASASASVIG